MSRVFTFGSIRTKLLASFGIVIALCLVVGIISYTNASNTVNFSNELENEYWPAADGAMMLKAAAWKKVYLIHGYLLEGEEQMLEDLDKTYEEEKEFLEEIEGAKIFESESRKVKNLNNQLNEAIAEIIAAYKAGNEDEIEKVMEQKLDPAYEGLTETLEGMDEKIDETMTTSVEGMSSAASNSKVVAMAATAIAALTGFGIATFTSNIISRNINEVAEVAEKIGAGNYAARSSIKSNDEVGLLAESINRMGESIENNVREIETKQKEIQEIMNAAKTPIIKIDRDFNIVSINEAGAAVAGKRPEEVIGMKCYQLFKTEHCNTDECRCYQAMKFKEKRSGQTIARPDSKEIPIEYHATPLLDEKGGVIGVVEQVVDLTEIKKKEKEIQELIDGAETPIIKVDRDLTIQLINKAGASIIGKKPEEIVGMKCYELCKTDHCNTDECRTTQAMKFKETRSGETVARPAGKEMPIMYVATPILNEKGEVTGAVEQIVNIKELKDKENEIRKVKEYIEGEVNRLLPVIEAAAQGDLTQEIEARSDDALGRLIRAFNNMRENLKQLIEQINDTSTTVTATAQQLTAGIEEINNASRSVSETAQKISAGAEEQTSAIEKANKQMEEISGITEETASSAESVLNIAQEANAAAEEGYSASTKAIKNMDELAVSASQVTKEVEDLVKKAEKIGEIVDVITKIAEQTSLLALNANIEAARVGEQGRGFAVVAGEVGKLANETQESARNIAELITDIQESMHRLASSVKNSGQKTEEAVKSVSDVMEKIERIKRAIEDTATGMKEIKRAMEDQANAVQSLATNADQVYQIALANAREIEGVAAATEEQTSSIDEIAKSSEDLTKMADNLIQMVKRFKLN